MPLTLFDLDALDIMCQNVTVCWFVLPQVVGSLGFWAGGVGCLADGRTSLMVDGAESRRGD
jgi:hypothetical protein